MPVRTDEEIPARCEEDRRTHAPGKSSALMETKHIARIVSRKHYTESRVFYTG